MMLKKKKILGTLSVVGLLFMAPLTTFAQKEACCAPPAVNKTTEDKCPLCKEGGESQHLHAAEAAQCSLQGGIAAVPGLDYSKYENEKVELKEITSLEPVKSYFNQNKDKNRLLVIMSSSCGVCINGANAVRESVLNQYPDKKLSIAVVWADMRPGDGIESAEAAAKLLNDPRLKQFHDSKNLTGQDFALALGAENQQVASEHPASDIYMFFPEGESWGKNSPAPKDFIHQVKEYGTDWPYLDAAHFTTGEKTYQQLAEIAQKY